MYNYENYLTHPFISFLIGFIIFLGISILGFYLIKIFFRELLEKNNEFLLNSPLVGTYFTLFILTPLIYFELTNIYIFKIIAFSLILIFVFFFFSNYKNIKKFINNYSQYTFSNIDFLIFTILFLYFLISIAPVTHADSLGYHMLGGVNLILNENLMRDILPMEIKLVGPGETIIALGLSLGSEQLGGIIQFSSLSTIYYCFRNINKSKIYKFLFLGVITVPTFLMLASSPKPQLMQISAILLISFLVYKIYKKEYPESLLKKLLFLIIILTTLNVLIKYSFILSSLILSIFLLFILVKNKKVFQLFYPLLLSLIILVTPKFLYMNNYFNTDLFTFIQSSLPLNLSLYESVSSSLRNISAGNRLFPTWLIIPTDLKFASETIGPIVLSFLFFKFYKKKELNIILFSIIFFMICVLTFGQATSRFLFEGFVILQMFLLISTISSEKTIMVFKKYVFFQSSVCVLVLLYFVIKLTPGILSHELRKKVMINNANGYELMNWLNKRTIDNESVMTSHRSLGLINNKSFSILFLNYLNKNKNDYEEYVNFLDKSNIKKILVLDVNELGIFKNCVGEKIDNIKNIKTFTGRNPLNQYSGEALLYNVSGKFKNCMD